MNNRIHKTIIYLAVVLSAMIPLGVNAIAVPSDSTASPVDQVDTIKAKEIGEVVVSAELVKRKGKEDVITVTKRMREGTKNAGELLAKVPGVFFNPLNFDLKYRGSKNVLILVNGVEKNADYIKHLRPERFESIKIINMPTGIYADYDAVIDLRVKKTYQGYEGSVETYAQIMPGNRNGKGEHLRNSQTAGQFTYTRGKFNFDVYAKYLFYKQGLNKYYDREYPLNHLSETAIKLSELEPNDRSHSNNLSTYFAVDYDINSNHSISAKISLSPSSMHDTQNNVIKREFSDLNYCDTTFWAKHNAYKDHLAVNAGVWYRGKVSGWDINSHFTYNHIGYTWINNVALSSGYVNKDERDISSKYITGAVETTRQSNNKKWTFTLSDNFILTNFREDRAETGATLTKSSDFRNIFTGSVQYQGNEKFSAGLNAGFTVYRNTYNDISDTYVNPRLTANASWFPSKNASFRLSYTLIPYNPSIAMTQDYGQFTDSLMYSAGNPKLKPSLNHSLSLSTTFFNSLTINAGYYHSTNNFYSYYFPEHGIIPSGADTYYTRDDYVNGTYDRWKVNITYSKSFGKHWTLSLGGSLSKEKASYQNSKASALSPEYEFLATYQTMNNSLRFYFISYLSSWTQVSPQSDLRGRDNLNSIAVYKSFFNNKLELLAQWIMPFHFINGDSHGGTISPSYNLRTHINNQISVNNLLAIQITYKFNGGQSVKKYDRSSNSVSVTL